MQTKATPEEIQRYKDEPEKAYVDAAAAEQRVLEAQARIAELKIQFDAAEETTRRRNRSSKA